MSFAILSAVFLTALVATVLLAFPVRAIAFRKGWVDKPDGERKLHSRATPNVGGLAIAAGFAAGLGLLFASKGLLPFQLAIPEVGLWVGALLMIVVGFYDDTRGMTFKRKFLFQIVAAVCLVQAGYAFDFPTLPFMSEGVHEALVIVPVTVFWIVAVTNAINLIDGLDGLATGTVYISLACLTIVFTVNGDAGIIFLTVPLIGALGGFLIHNFNRASVFMGDSGSLFLGFMLAAASLQGRAHVDPALAILIPTVVLGLPFLDTTLCVVRRTLTHRSIFAPDHDHIHHRLLRLWRPRSVVITLYIVALSFGVVAIMMTLLATPQAFMLLGATLIMTVAGIGALGYFRLLRLYIRRTFFRRKEGAISSKLSEILADRKPESQFSHFKQFHLVEETSGDGEPNSTSGGVSQVVRNGTSYEVNHHPAAINGNGHGSGSEYSKSDRRGQTRVVDSTPGVA